MKEESESAMQDAGGLEPHRSHEPHRTHRAAAEDKLGSGGYRGSEVCCDAGLTANEAPCGMKRSAEHEAPPERRHDEESGKMKGER